MKRLALATLLLATPAISRAQQSTADQIARAVALYEAFNVEAARPILLNIVSPGYLQQVSSVERATAYKYLGASYAVLANRDSARQFFIAALDFDPFTDLETTKFAASELAAFNEAKAQIFKLAVRPMSGPALIRPQPGVPVDSAAYTFRFISTQRANMQVSIAHQSDSTAREELYNGPNDGVRGIPWRGVLSDGRYAPPGVYTLTATGTPTGGGQEQRQTMSFRIEHIFEPLEDTLPALDPVDARQLLPVRYPTIAPWQDLAKGVFVGAVAAFALPKALTTDISTTSHAFGAAGITIATATGLFLYRRANPEIEANVIENARRQNLRSEFNRGVRQRNADRLQRTVLVITPVTTAQ